MTRRLHDGSQTPWPLPLEEESDGGSVAPAVPEGGDQLGLGTLHPRGHLIGYHHCDVVAGYHGEELLGKAAEQARSLQELIKERPERRRHVVDYQEADPGVIRQEARYQVKLCQQLNVVMTTDLRDTKRMSTQSGTTVPCEEYGRIITTNIFDRMDSTVKVSMATRCSWSSTSKEQWLTAAAAKSATL